MMIREQLLAGLARQLGRPHGPRGRLIGRALNKRNLTMVGAAIDQTGLRPGDTAADIGFGGGLGLRMLLDEVGTGGHVHGIDISTTMVQAARRRHRAECARGVLTVQLGSMGDLPLDDGSVDALISVNTVYFVDDLDRAMSDLARTLRPGGRLVLGIGDPTAMATMPVTQHGFRIRPVDELVEVLDRSGLGDVRRERVGAADDAAHLLIGSRTA